MDRTVVLSVGDMHKLGLGKDRIIYVGMPSENVFSIVQVRWESFYRGLPGIYISLKAAAK